MAVISELSPARYGKLLAKSLPKIIETDEEFDRYVQMMEELDRRLETLSAEEKTLLALLERLIRDYDDEVDLPEVPPDEMLRFLMEQRKLKQAASFRSLEP